MHSRTRSRFARTLGAAFAARLMPAFAATRRPAFAATLALLLVGSLGVAFVDAALAAGGETFSESDASAPVSAELPDQRTSNSETFQLANGLLRTEVYENPIHFKNAKGEWQTIDTNLVYTGLLSGYRSASTPVAVTIAALPGQVPLTLSVDGSAVGVELLGANVGAQTVDGDAVRFAAVTTDTDLVYQVLDDGVKETLSLNSVAAPNAFQFAIYHEGLTLAQDETGQWGLSVPNAAKPLLIMPRLTVSDSSRDEFGEPAYCGGAEMSVKVGAKKSVVTYTVPTAWLADAARVYPVRIDPTLTQGASADTFVTSDYPTNAYGTEQQIKTGFYAGATRRGLAKFDLSSLSSSAYVHSSTLSLWQTGSQTPTSAKDAYFGISTKSWSESSTWNSLNYTVNDHSDRAYIGTSSAKDNETMSVACGAEVQDWLSGAVTNRGFYLYQNEGGSDNFWRRFASREYTTDTSKRPSLAVVYEEPEANPSSAPAAGCEVGETVSVTVSVTDTAYAGEIREIRMGVNRALGPSSRYRGVMGWFLSKPGATWKTVNKSNGGYLAYYNDTAYGIDHITPDLAASQISSDHTQATFVFKVNGNYGDIQDNDFDTYLAMGPNDVRWNSGWLNKDTNFAVYPMAVTHVDYSTAPSAWYTEVDTTPADGVPDNPNCDTNTQGRGDVTLDWDSTTLADGYRIYLWDGGAYQPVGKVVGNETTSWSTGAANFYPKDSEISASGWPNGAAGNPFYRASTPDDPAQTQLLQPSGYSGSAGLLAGDGTYLYARARSGQSGSTYWKKIVPATQAVTQFGPNLSAKPALTAFAYNGRVYSGYAVKSGSTASITGVQTASPYGDGGTITFATLPLERNTGEPITATSNTVLLASDGTNIYNVSYTLTTSGGAPVYDGFKIRRYSMTGTPVTPDITLTQPSFQVSHVLVDANALYLCEWNGSSSASRVLKVDKTSGAVINEWEQDQATTQVCAGFYDTTNNLFWLGHLTTNKFYKYGGTTGGLDLRDNPAPMYAKTDGSSGDPWTFYRFCVVPYSGAAGSRSVADPETIIDEQLPVTLDKRTTGANDDRQHTTYDLGEWNGHSATTVLDTRKLELATTDLEVASWGPRAALDRHYSSARTGAGTRWAAPGWRFGFEQRLDATYTNLKTYTDESGVTHRYAFYDGAWQTPKGSRATLAPSGSEWVLTFPDENKLVFDASGKLVRETDKNANQVTYSWSGADMTQITASNGQTITLTYGSGKVTSASYATGAGTRTVDYATASPWRVTHYPGQGVQDIDEYTYTSSRLTSLTQRDWPKTGSNVSEAFVYTSADLTRVNFADYATNSEAHVEITYTSTTATVTGHARVNDVPNTSVPIETLTINSDGTCAQRKLAQNAGENTTTTYAYNIDFLPATLTEPDGGVTRTSYDAAGHAVGDTDQDKDLSTATYDYATFTGGRIKKRTVTGTDSLACYAYNAQGNLSQEVKILNANDAGVTEYTYADVQVGGATFRQALTYEKRLIDGDVTVNPDGSASVANGVWAETDYDSGGYWPNGEPKTIVYKGVQLTYNGTPQDLSVAQDYDAFGNLHTETDTSGTRIVEHDHYDLAGRLSDSIDAGGATTHHTYDKLGYDAETWTTHSSSQVIANWTKHYAGTWPTPSLPYGIDAMGRTLKEWTYLHDGTTATLQSVVEHTYDGFGNEVISNDNTVGGQNAKTIYDKRSNVTSQFDEGVLNYTDAARSTRNTYNGSDELLDSYEVGSASAHGSTDYTIDGNLQKETQADGSWIAYTYDERSNQLTEKTPLAGYDPSSNPSAVAVTESGYDAGDRLVSETDPKDQLTAFGYDALDRQTDADGGAGASPVVYNTLGWELKRTDADGVAVVSTYDAAGRLTAEKKGSQNPTSYSYDDCGRILSQTDPDGRLITNTYDGFGNQAEERHTVSSTEVRHIDTTVDSLGRPTVIEDTKRGNKRSFTYPVNSEGGVQETLRYDATASVSTVISRAARGTETQRQTTATGSPNLVVTRTVDARDVADRWTQATFATNITSQRLFDDSGRLTRQWGTGYAGGAANSDAYAYDPDTGKKNADNLQLSYGGTISASYGYDADGRLSQTGGASCSYDELGNLTTDGGKTFAYDAANRLVQMVDGANTTIFKWNTAYGWRTSQGPSDASQPVTYGYTATGRLATYGNTTTGGSATYSYDAAGQRSRSVVTQSGATTTTDYTYDDITLLALSATKGSQSWKIAYLYDEEGTPYGAIYRDPASSTSPLVFAIVTSDRGDVVELLDANGAPFAAYRYDAWGKPTSTVTQSTSLINAALAQTIAERQVLRYASYCWDAESGLCYCSARSYDPSTRQWISKDPEKADGEESAYQYCGGEPVNCVDSSGEYTARSPVKTYQRKMARVWPGLGGRIVDFTAYNYFQRSYVHPKMWLNTKVTFRMMNEKDDIALWKNNVRVRIFSSNSRGARVVYDWTSGDNIVSSHWYRLNFCVYSRKGVTKISNPGTPGTYSWVLYDWRPNIPVLRDTEYHVSSPTY